jgi:hypothetical protein
MAAALPLAAQPKLLVNAKPDTRKQAMSSLGQSRDGRAISFFEEVLKK